MSCIQFLLDRAALNSIVQWYPGSDHDVSLIKAFPKQKMRWGQIWDEVKLREGKGKIRALVIANTLVQQPKRRLYTWTSPDGQRWNQIDYIVCSQRWRSSIQSAKTRPEAEYGSDHELLIAKFRLKLKKVGKTTRPFRYDLNQIPYDYTWKWEIDLRD